MFRHEILEGSVPIYRREGTRHWHCSASLKGVHYRATTKQEDHPQARQFAEDWYLELRGKSRAGLLWKFEKTFAEAAEQFLKEYETITEGQRGPVWVQSHAARLCLHLILFVGALGVSEVTPGKVQDHRVHRMTSPPTADSEGPARIIANGERRSYTRPWKAPSCSTLHDEIVTLRQVLDTAIRQGWLAYLHDFSPPYRTSSKVVYYPRFSPAEYKQLYTATRKYAREMHSKRHRWNAEQVHDCVLFMANSGLRPDETNNLQHRDVTIAKDRATVRRKRGVGFCKSMPAAVQYYERLLNRAKPVSANVCVAYTRA
jgi:integrase